MIIITPALPGFSAVLITRTCDSSVGDAFTVGAAFSVFAVLFLHPGVPVRVFLREDAHETFRYGTSITKRLSQMVAVAEIAATFRAIPPFVSDVRTCLSTPEVFRTRIRVLAVGHACPVLTYWHITATVAVPTAFDARVPIFRMSRNIETAFGVVAGTCRITVSSAILALDACRHRTRIRACRAFVVRRTAEPAYIVFLAHLFLRTVVCGVPANAWLADACLAGQSARYWFGQDREVPTRFSFTPILRARVAIVAGQDDMVTFGFAETPPVAHASVLPTAFELVLPVADAIIVRVRTRTVGVLLAPRIPEFAEGVTVFLGAHLAVVGTLRTPAHRPPVSYAIELAGVCKPFRAAESASAGVKNIVHAAANCLKGLRAGRGMRAPAAVVVVHGARIVILTVADTFAVSADQPIPTRSTFVHLIFDIDARESGECAHVVSARIVIVTLVMIGALDAQGHFDAGRRMWHAVLSGRALSIVVFTDAMNTFVSGAPIIVITVHDCVFAHIPNACVSGACITIVAVSSRMRADVLNAEVIGACVSVIALRGVVAVSFIGYARACCCIAVRPRETRVSFPVRFATRFVIRNTAVQPVLTVRGRDF